MSIAKEVFGVYYTKNNHIIDLMLNKIIDLNKIHHQKILEPSCGDGAFILRILYLLYKNNFTYDDIIYILENSIYVNDISQDALHKTKKNILEFLENYYQREPRDIELNLINVDFTKMQKSTELFSDDNRHPFYNLKNKFDIVIGNPPFVTMYGRRSIKKSEVERKYYLSTYSQFPNYVKNGKLNYAMFFIEHSLELLKSTGNLIFILDISFFETAFKYTRKYILDSAYIKEIIYNIKSFKNVTSGQVIVYLEKKRPFYNKKHSIAIAYDYNKDKKIYINTEKWDKPENEYKFEIISNEAEKMLNKILNKTTTNFYSFRKKKLIRTCCMLLNMENKFTGETDRGKLSFKYYEGAKGLTEKYGLFNSNKFFYYDKKRQDEINNELKISLSHQGIKNKKRIGLGEIEVYKNPKIYIRQSSKKLISSIDYGESAANNSLYAISFRNNNPDSLYKLKLISAQLNSKILTFFAQQKRIIRYMNGKQPQIKISDLNNLPIIQNSYIDNILVDLVNEIILYNKIEDIHTIDELLFEYYSISKLEQNYIEYSIANF